MAKKNSCKLEKLQERALRFVFSDTESSYEELLKRGNFLSLAALRLKFLAIEVYKSVNGLNPVYLNDLFKLKKSRYEFRDSLKLNQNKFDTMKNGYKSFQYYGSKLWNGIPYEIKSSESLYVFKLKITDWCRSDKADDFIIM